jgi:hypothetical protein
VIYKLPVGRGPARVKIIVILSVFIGRCGSLNIYVTCSETTIGRYIFTKKLGGVGKKLLKISLFDDIIDGTIYLIKF